MTNPRELLDTYADATVDMGEESGYLTGPDGDEVYGISRATGAPHAFAALRAVLDIHKPSSRVIDKWTYCYHCSDSNGDCLPWPCPTVRAITEALEGK
jgi:hypothetical protein